MGTEDKENGEAGRGGGNVGTHSYITNPDMR